MPYVVVLDACEGWSYLQDMSEALTQQIDEAMRFESYDEAWQTLSAICEKKESLHKYSKGWVKMFDFEGFERRKMAL